MEARKDRSKWHHPIPLSLLENDEHPGGILDIIDRETELLLENLRTNKSNVFINGDISTPIEKILFALDVNVTKLRHSRALGISGSRGSKIQIALNTKNQHYFRQRFTLAHELGHIWLSRFAGPFTYAEIAQTKDTNHEEEFLCDIFASALLMPKENILNYISDGDISWPVVNRIATDFKVSIGAVLRRLACVRGSILLLWNDIVNPLNAESEKAERIEVVYPNLQQLCRYFVPLYCTARDTRFEPNIFLTSLETGTDFSGEIMIRDFGSLPERRYRVHNIYFKRSARSLPSFKTDLKRRPYDMATLIDVPAR